MHKEIDHELAIQTIGIETKVIRGEYVPPDINNIRITIIEQVNRHEVHVLIRRYGDQPII